MSFITLFLDYILHIDHYLFSFVQSYGALTYLVLFLIIFCETGLVITPFLPGDSLLFTAGSLAALEMQNSLSLPFLLSLLSFASIIGNQTNYFLGKTFSQRFLQRGTSRFLSQKYLDQTQAFYEKHGIKTIILARFIPIIRTFAPFIAGLSQMKASIFLSYNLMGALLWIGSLLGLGYFFGSLPFVRTHFTLMIYGIILLSISPAFFAFLSHHCSKKRA